MMKVLKGLGVFFGIICSLLALIIICLVAINATDRTKSPNTLLIESWLKQPSIEASENAFEYALSIVGTTTEITPNDQAQSITFSNEDIALIRQFKTACHQHDLTHCSDFISDNSVDIASIISSHQNNIIQYHQLLKMPYWQEDLQYHTPTNQFNWGLLLKIRDVSELAAIMESNRSPGKLSYDATIQFLGKDTSFWNQVYHSTRSTYSHLVVVSIIKNQLYLANNLAKDNESLRAIKLTNWQSPFELMQSDFERIFSGEWLFGHNAIEQMLTEVQSDSVVYYEQWLADTLFKPTDSDNLMAEYMVNLVTLPTSATSEVAIEKPNYCVSDNYVQQLWLLRYNPVGKVLSCSSYEINLKQRLVNMNNEIEQLRTNLIVTQ
jgi:hypothetical protein